MITLLFWILFILFLFSSVVLILVVLVQSGKGGGLSGLVGAGSTLGDHLGATGAEKTLNRWTSYCAGGFLVINILMVILGPHVFRSQILANLPTPPKPPTEAVTTSTAATTTGTVESTATAPTAPEASAVSETTATGDVSNVGVGPGATVETTTSSAPAQ